MNEDIERSVALVLAAHGDRGGQSRNESIAAHAAALAGRGQFASVSWGVLNGEPSIEEALAAADASAAQQLIIYPLFMSAGYFVKTVLSDRVAAAGLETPAGILQPFGLDKRVPLMMLEGAVQAAKNAGLDPATARLLIASHGSKDGPENAESTKRAARILSPHSPFARVETAFLEESPFVADALAHYSGTSVVAGFFSGEGMHAGGDIPETIERSGARALYAGPVGLHPRVPDLIAFSVRNALVEMAGAQASAPAPVEQVAEAAAPEAPAPRASRRRPGLLRMAMKAAVALVMIAVLAVGAVAFLVPEDVVRDQVTSLVRQHTGRELTVRGKTSFAVFPNVGVELEDVSVSNPQGMEGGDVLRMEALNLNLRLMPLLTRSVEVDRFVLVKPEFNLVVDKAGRRNWDMQKTAAVSPGNDQGSTASVDPVPEAKPKMMQAQAGGIAGGMVKGITLGSVKIIDGAIAYSDQRAGAKQRIDAVNVTLTQPRVTQPLDAEGSLEWKGEKVTFDGQVESVLGLMQDTPSKARVALSTRHGKGSFTGQLSIGPALSANGDVTGESPSLRALAGWLGNPLTPGGGLGPASVKGHLGYEGQTVTFTKAQLSLDGMTGEGQASVRLKGVRPHVTASLTLDKLDLNPYLEGAPQGASQPAPAPAPRTAAPAPPVAAPIPAGPAPKPGDKESLTDFIEKLNKTPDGQPAPKPQVRAWSQSAINLTGLRALDADVKVNAGAIYYRQVKTGQSSLNATIKSGVLHADLTRLTLYSGSGTGRVNVNGARSVPTVSALFNLEGISALPLLKDLSGFNWISGRANLAISLAGTGESQSEMVRSLQGQGRLVFSDGAIEGINLPAMVRGLKQGQFSGWKRSEREKTDFSQLSGTFLVKQGVATNKDLNMVGPLIRMTGEGTIDLYRERVDYSALPRVVATLQGQGTPGTERGLAVPVRVTGPWASPKVVPDLERLLNDPELAKETINKAGKVLEKLKNKEDVNKLLDSVLGGGGQGGANAGQQGGEQKVKPEDVLKKLFR